MWERRLTDEEFSLLSENYYNDNLYPTSDFSGYGFAEHYEYQRSHICWGRTCMETRYDLKSSIEPGDLALWLCDTCEQQVDRRELEAWIAAVLPEPVVEEDTPLDWELIHQLIGGIGDA